MSESVCVSVLVALGVVRSTWGRVDTQNGGGVWRSGMGSLCDPLDASLSLSVSDTWGFWLLRAISEAGCVCVYLCLCVSAGVCLCMHPQACTVLCEDGAGVEGVAGDGAASGIA